MTIKQCNDTSTKEEKLFESIYQYLLSQPNHEQSKKQLKTAFDISIGRMQNIIDKMTHKYPIYESDNGKILGVLTGLNGRSGLR